MLGLLYASLLFPTTAAADTFSFSVNPGFNDVGMEVITGYDGCEYTRLSCDGCAYLSETGLPDIPYRIYEIEVPTYSNGFSVSIESCSMGGDVWLNAPVWPHQPPVSLNDNPADFFTPLSDEALAADIQPLPVVFDDDFQKGRIHTVRIGVPLYSHSSGAMSLTPYEAVDLQLEYQLCAPEEMCHRPVGLQTEVFECTLRGAQDDLTFEGNLPEDYFAGLVPGEPNFGYYYIITPEEFVDDLDMLVALKRAKGLDVRVHCIEDIVASTDGCDDAERLREWLYGELKDKFNRSHVLLVGGNKTSMPIRKFRKFESFDGDNENLPFDDDKYIPSDAYFSDLSTKYKLDLGMDGENYSCYLYNTSTKYSPTVPVGRLIVRNSEEIHNYISKLADYELLPGHGDTSYLGKGVSVMQSDGLIYSKVSLFDGLTFRGSLIKMTDNGNGTFEGNRPTGKEVITEMSDAGIVSLNGHGGPMFIGVSGLNDTNEQENLPHQLRNRWHWRYVKPLRNHFDSGIGTYHQFEYDNSFDELNNYHRPGILYSIGCHTVPLDTFGEEEGKPYNIGSAFTVAGLFGGVAYIGNTRSGYFYTSSKIEQRFGELLNSINSIGQTHMDSKKATTDRHCQMTNILIGDPELRVWNGIPSDMNVTHTPTANNDALIFSNVKQTPLCISNGSDWFQTFTSLSESWTISLQDFSAGNCYGESGCCGQIFISKSGYIPFTKLYVHDARINSKRTFVLNNNLYLNGNVGETISILNGGCLTLNCLKDISLSNSLKINRGGQVSLVSNGKISLEAATVDKGGILNANGDSVTLLPGFSVEKGGILEIKNTGK